LMPRVTFDDGSHWVITAHQFVDGTYIIVSDTKGDTIIYIKNINGWEKCGEGMQSYYRLPYAKLIVPKIVSIKYGPLPQANSPCFFVSIDPKTGKSLLGTSDVCFDPIRKLLSHSVSTENFMCGSILVCGKTKKILGLHVMTTGQSSRGHNNYCIPLN
jgi:hypothetical protein